MMNGIRVAVTQSDEPDRIYYGTTHTDRSGREYVLFDDDDVYYPESTDIVRELTGPDLQKDFENLGDVMEKTSKTVDVGEKLDETIVKICDDVQKNIDRRVRSDGTITALAELVKARAAIEKKSPSLLNQK